jgi:hypothetical protein
MGNFTESVRELIDYYEVLGVERDASRAEIRSAYRRRAHEFHPDLNKSENAERQFARLALAYRILSDDLDRARYDEDYRKWKDGASASFRSQNEHGRRKRRVRTQTEIDRVVDRLLEVDRRDNLALQKAVYPCVTLLLSTFFAAALRPTFFHRLSIFVQPLLIALFLAGVWHLGSRFHFYLENFARRLDDSRESSKARGGALIPACLFLVIGLVMSGSAGLALGQHLSGYIILGAMPAFFDQQIRMELLLYPPIVALAADTLHAIAHKLDL